ncbi:guanine nucleotide-binding [Cryptosporidium bovis]|uniref:guanine nucleotide-binding n=1 Tax=Cryptosporidium bovis TaxID=310047 RepID=UPI003519E489|nr:guanine nucleotide-binding [Cryptosporidium bovis]
MSFICGISGVVPEEPVISKTGYIFEKRLIHDYIKCNGCCPITKMSLDLSDLIEVKTENNVKPRIINNTSIPGILDSLRTEWDAIMMEMFQLKSELEQTKMQLSHTLYQHDASCRVIARISRERDNAIKRLAEIHENINNVETNDDGVSLSEKSDGCKKQDYGSGDKHITSPLEENVKRAKKDDSSSNPPLSLNIYENRISKETILEFEEYSEKMRPIRKKMTFPNILSSEKVKKFEFVKEIQIDTEHKLTHSNFVSDYILVSGHENGQIIVSSIYGNLNSDSSDSGEEHSHTIAEIPPPTVSENSEFNGVKLVSALNSNETYFSEYKNIPDKVIVNYSQDPSNIHIYQSNGGEDSFNHILELNVKKDNNFNSKLEVESFQAHPIKKYILANYKMSHNAGYIGNFSLFDIEMGSQICNYSVNTDNSSSSDYYSDVKIHPDGIIVSGIYSSGNNIDIWDIRTLNKITSIGPNLSNIPSSVNRHKSNKSFVSFSNNGYHLFSTYDLKIYLWDLRKSALLDSIDSGFIRTNSNSDDCECNIKINLDESGRYISSIYEDKISIFSFIGKNKLEKINTFCCTNGHYGFQDSHFSNNVNFISALSNNNIRIWSSNDSKLL